MSAMGDKDTSLPLLREATSGLKKFCYYKAWTLLIVSHTLIAEEDPVESSGIYE